MSGWVREREPACVHACVLGVLFCVGFNCNHYISMMTAMIVGINIVINTDYDGNNLYGCE